MMVSDIDKILYTQLIIARMGEKELMNWWNTDIAHEMGGADFLGRLLGKTMAPLSAGEGILRAAYLKEMQTINKMPNNDSVCTLFRPEPEVAIGIEERYRHFKRYPESLPDDIAEILAPKKDWSSHQLAELIRPALSAKSTGTSFGMEIDKPEGFGIVEIMGTMASIIKSYEKGRYTLIYYRKG
jgi:hypothetical protein